MLTLQECCEKQVEQPPKVVYADRVVTYRCPWCHSVLLWRAGNAIVGNRTKYCCNCGQRLTWSEHDLPTGGANGG